VYGWHRKFCLHLTSGRGSPEQPGLMLALDRGGACVGVSLRIPAAILREELALVWRREMFSGAYEARWLAGRVGGEPARLLTFVANRAQPRYIGTLDEAEIVRRLAHARGHLGSGREYLEHTVAALQARGLHDAKMQRLLRLVAASD
jgi:cation transport protein ChaC